MKKETVIAVCLGIIFGVAVAIGLLVKTRDGQFQGNKPLNSAAQVTPTVIVSKTALPQNLQIVQPETGTITSTKSITIKGKTSKNAVVVIQSPIKNMVVRTDKEDFSIDFPLASGENVINITAYPKDAQSAILERELRVYSLDES
ncbi:hypothetical protein HGB07_05525 [Candidatus Roizmanbacteria bacterium]|nr:hypothetical protein [Candidatus Roizmanbacteria bacterium]